MSSSHLPLLALLLLAVACGDDGGPPPPPDGGGGDMDATVTRDGGGGDTDATTPPTDAGDEDDASTSDEDASTPVDGGGSTCPDDLGAFCDDGMPCAAGYECMVGRCAPQGRATCGGFAGWTCDTPPYTACLYFSSADYGPCFTEAEARCLCALPDPGFSCP